MSDAVGLTAHATRHDDRVVFHLSGELDLATVPILDRLLAQNAQGDIEVDCSELNFLDSSGLGVLLSTSKSRSITLVHPNELIMSVLDITGVKDLFRIVP